MIIDADERIEKLKEFLRLLEKWENTHSDESRALINQSKKAAEREVGAIFESSAWSELKRRGVSG